VESDPKPDILVADLRRLGRSIPSDSAARPEALAAAVLARLADAPPPRPASAWQRLRQRTIEAVSRQRRRITVAVLVVLLGGLGVPGVRAAVIEWFGFDGVRVKIQPLPGPSVTQAPPPPRAQGGLTPAQARALVRFRPVTLSALGTPTGVEVSADRRVLSLTWDGASTTRLDQFDGRLDYVFAKTSPGVQWAMVDGESAVWFDQPHEVAVLDAEGRSRTETARLAGHTLIWEHDGTVLRLEGDFTQARAIEIAGTAETMP
jgi:hypothetical protein